jgi:hypothetical protein
MHAKENLDPVPSVSKKPGSGFAYNECGTKQYCTVELVSFILHFLNISLYFLSAGSCCVEFLPAHPRHIRHVCLLSHGHRLSHRRGGRHYPAPPAPSG